MPQFIARCPIVAYASMVISTKSGESDFEFLRRWCAKLPIDLEILADDVHPSAKERPFWMDLMNEIERGAISTLVVPSLFHIAGDDYIALSRLLTFLKTHRVTLKSLVEVIDSGRDSKTDIIMRSVQETRKSDNLRGA